MQQRYSAASCGGGVSNSAVGGASSRENARVESSYSASNFSLNSRLIIFLCVPS